MCGHKENFIARRIDIQVQTIEMKYIAFYRNISSVLFIKLNVFRLFIEAFYNVEHALIDKINLIYLIWRWYHFVAIKTESLHNFGICFQRQRESRHIRIVSSFLNEYVHILAAFRSQNPLFTLHTFIRICSCRFFISMGLKIHRIII